MTKEPLAPLAGTAVGVRYVSGPAGDEPPPGWWWPGQDLCGVRRGSAGQVWSDLPDGDRDDTMCAEDWNANCAHTQQAWALADAPEVVDYQEEYRQWLGVVQIVGGIAVVVLCAIVVMVSML